MVKWLLLSACYQIHLPPETRFSSSTTIGSVEAREYVLIAYRAQFNQESERSMQAFSRAVTADPQNPVLLLLWADSAWEQGYPDLAREMWERYAQTLPNENTTELEQIRFKLEQP